MLRLSSPSTSRGIQVTSDGVILDSSNKGVLVVNQDDNSCLCGSPCPWELIRCFDEQPANIWMADVYVEELSTENGWPFYFAYNGLCYRIDDTSERGEVPAHDEIINFADEAVLAIGGCGNSPCGCDDCDPETPDCIKLVIQDYAISGDWHNVGGDTLVPVVVTGSIDGTIYLSRTALAGLSASNAGPGACFWTARLPSPITFTYTVPVDGDPPFETRTYTWDAVGVRRLPGRWRVSLAGSLGGIVLKDLYTGDCQTGGTFESVVPDNEAEDPTNTHAQWTWFDFNPIVGAYDYEGDSGQAEGTITLTPTVFGSGKCECPTDCDELPEILNDGFGAYRYPDTICIGPQHIDVGDSLFVGGTFPMFNRGGCVWNDGQYAELICTTNGDAKQVWQLTINTRSNGHVGDGLAVWQADRYIEAFYDYHAWTLVSWIPLTDGTPRPALAGIDTEICCPSVCVQCCQQVTVTPTHSGIGATASSFNGLAVVFSITMTDCLWESTLDPSGTVQCATRFGAGPEKRWRITMESHLHPTDGIAEWELNRDGSNLAGCPDYMNTLKWVLVNWTPDTGGTPAPDDLPAASVVWGVCPP